MTHRPATTRPLAAGKLPGDFLDRLIESYRTLPDPSVVVAPGYGRDAAVVNAGTDSPIIIKSDPITFATDNAAHYLIAVNANDIACLGGIPRWISVVLLLPEKETTAAMVEALFADLQRAADAQSISLVGGHTEVTAAVSRPIFVGTMLGLVGPAGLLPPGRARSGDDLYLTQSAGLEGTALLAREKASDLQAALDPDLITRAAALLDTPGISVVPAASALLKTGAVTALHDPTEGGVATAIHEIAAASGLGAEIDRDRIPVRPETLAISSHYDIDPLGLISSGALLIAARNDQGHLAEAATAEGIPLTRIGRLTPVAEGVRFADGQPVPRFDSDEITRVL